MNTDRAKIRDPEVPGSITDKIQRACQTSFESIAPFWPLKSLIAVNPLQGFEHKPFGEAFCQASLCFQNHDLPKEMALVNQETIKWLQVLLDHGQATLRFTRSDRGIYENWKSLAVHDARLHRNDLGKRNILQGLPEKSEDAISFALERLEVGERDWVQFMTGVLTILPGWASAVKYRAKYTDNDVQILWDYMAIRIILVLLLWPDAKGLLTWWGAQEPKDVSRFLDAVERAEASFRENLIPALLSHKEVAQSHPTAQFVFCIDVRSEPFRRFLEQQGPYETFGFAGFFGIPARVERTVNGEAFDACPVLLKPQCCVQEVPLTEEVRAQAERAFERVSLFKKLYQSLKYAFTTPLCLVESVGSLAGLWMALKTFSPKGAKATKTLFHLDDSLDIPVKTVLDGIPLEEQSAYGESALRLMGLTRSFAPIVVLCGHKSATQNNAFASSLDCGACGGHAGTSSARILATILNNRAVRIFLRQRGIDIPDRTHFVPATHNTTTDDVVIDPPSAHLLPDKIKADLEKAGRLNAQRRLRLLGDKKPQKPQRALRRSLDWAQVRPEWGLAGNAAFIVGPRALTRSADLEGRCFLHSYDASTDPDASMLGTILSAPMVVAQWINAQYLFSTYDNAAYGAGSKVTKNITGKHGVMQGNASDLMTGLPLQSLYLDDHTPFYTPQRLLMIVFAKRDQVTKALASHPAVQKLFQNDWVRLVCIEHENTKKTAYGLEQDMTWSMFP